jgi:hypothetical protein
VEERRQNMAGLRVHEVYVHLTRGDDGDIRRRDLVVVPSFRPQA